MTSNEYKTIAEKMTVTDRIKRLQELRSLLLEAGKEKTAIENSLIEKYGAEKGMVVPMKGKGIALKLDWSNTFTTVDVDKLKAANLYHDFTKQSYRKDWDIA